MSYTLDELAEVIDDVKSELIKLNGELIGLNGNIARLNTSVSSQINAATTAAAQVARAIDTAKAPKRYIKCLGVNCHFRLDLNYDQPGIVSPRPIEVAIAEGKAIHCPICQQPCAIYQ